MHQERFQSAPSVSWPELSSGAAALCTTLEQITGKPCTPTDRLKAEEHIGEFGARLSVQHMCNRMRGLAALRMQEGKQPLTTMAGYRGSLRHEYDYVADGRSQTTTHEADVPVDRDPDDPPLDQVDQPHEVTT